MVATSKKYEIIDMETGQLDRRIFVDQAIYDEEMEKIFGRAWLMVAHESLVPNPNDFFLSYMGEDPVIVTRDARGKLHVLLNMCRHRGNRVVRAEDGCAARFMCTYHGWTFDSDGCLSEVPGENQAYFSKLDKASMGLIEARVDTYAGIIFACWDQEAPSLEDYLGDARWYLDTTFNRYAGGMVALGPQKWMEPCNWKTPVDNCSDNYHVPISHFSSSFARNKVSGEPLRTMQMQMEEPNQNHHAFVNGHSLTFRVDGQDSAQRLLRGPQSQAQEVLTAWRESKKGEVEERLGAYRANQLRMGNHSIFPNGVLGFRLALPRGPYKTEFWHFVLVEKEAPQETWQGASSASANQNGIAGVFEQDDMDNWRQVTESSKSPIARRFPADLSMGIGHAGAHDDWPGLVSERYISESNQRNFYHRWMEFMNADSWSDIPLEQMRASFEGTAGLHG